MGLVDIGDLGKWGVWLDAFAVKIIGNLEFDSHYVYDTYNFIKLLAQLLGQQAAGL